MFFVYKKTLEKFEQLTPKELHILKSSSQQEDVDKEDFLKKLLNLKEDHWIACGCRQFKAIIVICKKANGVVYLRSKNKQEHDEQCLFFCKDVVLMANKAKVFIPSHQMKVFSLYTQNETLVIEDFGSKNDNSKYTINKLGKVLYTLLVDSKVNLISPLNNPATGWKNLNQQLLLIREASVGKPIYNKILLNDYFHYALTEKSLNYARNKLLSAMWPKHLRPFVLFMDVATHISNRSFSNNKKEIKTETDIGVISPWISRSSSAPYLVLASYVLSENGNAFFKDAFALPVLSETELLPVESNFERGVLKTLIGVIKKEQHKNITIEKPLFSLTTVDKLRYRPDFIIYNENNKNIFVEVLGSKNEDYLAHKKYMRKIAQTQCQEYIEVKGYDLKKEYLPFKERIRKALNNL